MNTQLNEYDIQATQFLASNGLKLRATLSDTKAPAWIKGEKHGHHYRVQIWREGRTHWNATDKPAKVVPSPRRLTFDFWGSIADAESGKAPTPYDIIACISSDAYTPETFEDWCSEYGYDSDSLNALQTFRRCNAFAKRLRAFFTPAELEQLSEIQ